MVNGHDNVIQFDGITTLDIPADRVLENNVGLLETVILIGIDKNGEFYCASNIGDVAEANLLVDRYKNFLINTINEFEED